MPDLELALRSLGERDDLFPATPRIATDVAAQIGNEQPPRGFDWRMVAIVALVVLAALATALAVPGSRTAIADFFGIEGIRIEFGEDDAQEVPGTPTSIGGSLLLGERTTLDAAAEAALLGPASASLPDIGDTEVGMLLLEIESDADDEIFIKKAIGGGEFTTAMVGDWPGYWIEGGVLTVEPVEGLMLDLLEPQSRRSGNVLIWSDGEITYRLETSLPMADAVRIAASLAPVGHADP
jgi:hypothetical protein